MVIFEHLFFLKVEFEAVVTVNETLSAFDFTVFFLKTLQKYKTS